jgi:hypothetical protein
MKIKEFIDGLDYPKKVKRIDENREFLKQEICKGLTTKRFCKNKSIIDYDEKIMKIKSISCLGYNKKKGIYEIDWDE